MAHENKTIENPITGARIVFLKTARDTNGELLQMDYTMQPHGFVAAQHVHPLQEERFEVLAGTASFLSGTEPERKVSAGETLVVPAGTPHIWWNPGDEEAHLILEFRPALRTQTFFETLFGLAADGKCNKKGLPNPLQLAVIGREFDKEGYLARPPLPIQRALFGALAPLGKLLGYRARYPQYSGPE